MDASITASRLLGDMAAAAKAKYATDAAWAAASGVTRETLSRLKGQDSCDLRTLGALARSAGLTLAAVPALPPGDFPPDGFAREQEEGLLDLCVSGNVDPVLWRRHGSGFFVGGVAVLLASVPGFDRERYLRLAEALHVGVSTPEVFAMWLDKSPLRPSRFLPMVRMRRRLA